MRAASSACRSSRPLDLAPCFASGTNLTRTEDAPHIHVNTVTQRIERITRLPGEGWQRDDRALEIRLSPCLHQLGAPRWATGTAENLALRRRF